VSEEKPSLPSPSPLDPLSTRHHRHPTGKVERGQPPHEGELHDVAVNEQKLRASTPLSAGDGLHARVRRRVVGRQKDVFEAAELWSKDKISKTD